MTITVLGTLTSASRRSFTGYRVSAVYSQPVVVGDHADGQVAAETKRVEALVQDDGFSLVVPDVEARSTPVTLTVSALSGLIVSVSSPSEADLKNPLAIAVADDAAPAVVDPATDLTLGASRQYSGRVIDTAGRSAPSGVIVVLWGVPLGGRIADAYPLDVPVTSGGGYLSGAWPPDELSEAFATVGRQDPVSIPVGTDRRLPQRFVVVVAVMPTPAGRDGDDCGCESPPRTPSAADLATDLGSYAADAGRCIDFTVPNRTLEEVEFQAVVRTTQPELRGVIGPRASTVPDRVVARLVELARQSPELAEAVSAVPAVSDASIMTARATATGASRPSRAVAVPADTLRGLVADDVLEQAAGHVRTLLGGVDLEQEVRVPMLPQVAAAAALAARDTASSPLKLEPSVLAELSRESAPLTPLRLLQAEQSSVVREFRAHVNVIGNANPPRFELGDAHQVDWDSIPWASQATTIAHGHILTFKQIWKADGYSLGDLLYSLPLAPGQQKLISVLDWERRETDAREATRVETEAVSADLQHDRDITDVIRASLSERMEASSSAHTEAVGGGIAGFIGPLVFGAAGGVSSAGSTAHQTSARDVNGSSLNQVRDRTLQAASAVRGQRTTVVQTSRQGESVRAQTEVVANYNHCHAMTVEYFEVLRHFQVSQELARAQECLFVPFLMSPFTQSKALRWRRPLQLALRRRDLSSAFDALQRVSTGWVKADVPLGRYADEAVNALDGELWIRMHLRRPADNEDGSFNAAAWAPWQPPWLWDTADHIWQRYLGVVTQERRDAVWNRDIAPGVAQRIINRIGLQLVSGGTSRTVTVDPTLVSPFVQDQPLLIGVRVDPGTLPGWTRAEITRLDVAAPGGIPGDASIIVESADLRYRTDHLAHAMVANRRVLNDLGASDDVQMTCPLDSVEKRNPRDRDVRVSRDLLDHLDEYLEYYHRAIWLHMDPNRRYMLLDGFEAPDAAGRSVASVVENRIIGIVGNCLVLPVAPGVKLDPTYEYARQTPNDLRHLYAGASVQPMRISMPTRGVFADAVLGQCNSCEKIDDTRFWRFEEEPIPDRPGALLPLSTDSRARSAPNLAPDEFPEPLVRLQATPIAPDPTGLAAAMRALGTTGIFQDITGLALNQANSAQALKSAITAAQGFATQAGALAQQKYLNRELDNGIDRIKQARAQGLINQDEAQRLTASAIRGAIGEVRPAARPATESEPVRRAIERVTSASNGGSLRVTRPEGSVELRTGSSAGRPSLDAAIDPEVAPIRQPSTLVCWAAAGTMMLSWRNQMSMTIQSALDSLGGRWRAAFDANEGLGAAELQGFFQAVGLTAEGPASYTPEGLARLLQSEGPLLVIGDDSIENNLVSHIRIVTAVRGDGTADGTTVTVADSETGTFRSLPFAEFARLLEARDPVRIGLGIYHF